MVRFISSVTPRWWSPAARRFLIDICNGAIRAKSLVLSEGVRETAPANGEGVRAAYKRLDRNLGSVDLTFSTRCARQKAYEHLTPDHVVAIDPGDIAKPAARRMEGLGRVADGSNKHQITSGFFLLGAVAVNPSSVEKTPIPIALELFSAEDRTFVSENHLILSLVGEMAAACQRRGFLPHCVIDRGGDRGRLLGPFVAKHIPFTIRLNKRTLIDEETKAAIAIPQKSLRRNELPHTGQLARRSEAGKRSPMYVRFSYRCVRLRGVAGAEGAQLWHATFWEHKADEPIELITSKPIHSPRQALEALARYLSRWAVEEYFRFCKVSLGIEKVRTHRLWATKQLIQVAFLCSQLLASMHSWEREHCIVAACRIGKHKRRFCNDSYAILNGIAAILRKSFIRYRRVRASYVGALGAFSSSS
jgi:hypothetical protein